MKKFIYKQIFLTLLFFVVFHASKGQCRFVGATTTFSINATCSCYSAGWPMTFQPNETRLIKFIPPMGVNISRASFHNTAMISPLNRTTTLSPNDIAFPSGVLLITNTTSSVVTTTLMLQTNGSNRIIQIHFTDISGPAICPSDLVLPVTLVDFVFNQYSKALEWETLSEESFEEFVIEHSNDGLSFNVIGTLKGYNQPSFYQWPLDNTTGYFRLKMVDKNGEYAYSEIIKGSTPSDEHSSVIFNAIKEYLVVNSVSAENKLVIRTIHGDIIYQSSLTAGINKVNLTALPSGLYLFQLDNNKVEKLLKF